MVISLFGHVVVLWTQFIARKTPHGRAIAGLNRMVFGSNFDAAVPRMLAIIDFAAVLGITAIWRFGAILLDQ